MEVEVIAASRGLRGVLGNCSRGTGSSLLSVTIPYDMDFGLGAGLFWSNIPFAFPAVCIIIAIATRRVTPLLLAAVGLLSSAINEGLLWHIHDEGRPSTSCLDGRAFPSGHSGLSFAVLWFIVWETLLRLYWSWPRKIWIIFAAFVVFFPVGPKRIHIGDHTWQQVGAGWVWGFVWSIIAFIVVHIFCLFVWEPFQCVRFLRWLVQNDYDPKFKYSIWRGKLYEKHVPEGHTYHDWHVWEHPLSVIYYSTLIFSLLVFAVWGIIVGPLQKHRDSTCDRASWGVASGCGVVSFIAAFFFIIFVILLMLFKSKQLQGFRERHFTLPEGLRAKKEVASKYLFANELNPFSVIDVGYFAALWWGEGITWAIAGVSAADEDHCDSGTNATLPYFIIWVAIEAILVVAACLGFWMYSFVRFLQRLHTYRKHRREGAGGRGKKRKGGGSEKPEHADTEMARLSPSVYKNPA